ncbi:MAG TPA: hypothetical protein VN982_11180 [Candidatus Dormibacteraeota bacterium]|nr:hypothetical protein [Candidatus Dormibacteraeota bacterium]
MRNARSFIYGNERRSEKGVALIAVLLLLAMLSAVAVALVYKVNHEQHLQRTDMANTLAYYGAEAAMEKMMSDLSTLYAQKAAPTNCDINTLQGQVPNNAVVGVTYPEYVFNVPANGGGCAALPSTIQTVSSGPNEGLQAMIVPMTLAVTADRQGVDVDEARLIRRIEIAEIPVFQFGVFSQSDLSYFPGPDFDFSGRVHSNGNLFLSSGGTLTFHSKIRAAGDIVRDQLANGADTVAQGRRGNILVPTAPSGCDAGKPACRNLQVSPNEGSSIGGPTPPYGGTGAPNNGSPSWTTISKTTYNGMILSGTTGVKPLTLPFVQPGVGPIEIIRRPLVGEAPGSAVGVSRLYNQAQIRVLLSDDPNELPGGVNDGQNIRLANVKTSATAPDYTNGVPVTGASNTYFAEAKSTIVTDPGGIPVTPYPAGPGNETNWTAFPTVPPVAKATLKPVTAPLLPGKTTTVDPVTGNTSVTQSWNLLDGYLRVEYRDGAGNYIPVTKQWLELGFARGIDPPGPGNANTVHPNAILILQKQADRNGNKTAGPLVTDGGTNSVVTGAATRNNWYPINMYDSREGEYRENARATPNCSIGGVLNVAEIDVNNLKRWLAGNPNQVEFTSQNGYILYFSDRRGTVASPNAGNIKTGEYGFEDVINLGNVNGNPNGKLDAGEDANENGVLDNYSSDFLGLGFGVVQPGSFPNTAVSCMNTARVNWVSGPRHAVRLVNAQLGNVPVRPDNALGGFTLASEQPAYVLGNYNANGGGFGDPHASSAVIADTVTLLSNNWNDLVSFKSPADVSGRPATTSYYRLAIATGKNINFKFIGNPQDFGTDGGVHNFLRYMENWGGQSLNYRGSMASLYFSQYATGVFKCCGTVYSPPTRQYVFDVDFLDLSKMPPGTPKFRDVVNVGFQQVY